MKALVIGATGATGKNLVDILLHDADYTAVVIFVRTVYC
jgi:N-acetyl-gamma-glutamylphosphate reductase